LRATVSEIGLRIFSVDGGTEGNVFECGFNAIPQLAKRIPGNRRSAA
jgi:hypothetical protein